VEHLRKVSTRSLVIAIFASLQGDRFRRPLTEEGECTSRLGGMWFLAASLFSFPRALRDLGYVTRAKRSLALRRNSGTVPVGSDAMARTFSNLTL